MWEQNIPHKKMSRMGHLMFCAGNSSFLPPSPQSSRKGTFNFYFTTENAEQSRRAQRDFLIVFLLREH